MFFKRIMSGAEDDEKSLLEAIRRSVGRYDLEAHISHRIYPYTSYILKNVTALRLDGRKMTMTNLSGERVVESTVEEFDFISSDLGDISIILKEIERASPAKKDEHNFALSLPKKLRKMSYTMNFILVGTLAAFAVTHGVWLLVLKFICADSSEEDIVMVVKRVEGLFITLRRNLGKTDYHPDFYIYISLLSSSITRMPIDNWESMDSLYSLIKAMFEVISVAHLFLKDVYEFIPKSLKDEFDSLMLLSIYWVTRGVVACSSQCDKLPKNRFVIQDSRKLSDICDELIFIHKRLQTLENNGKQFMDDEKIANAYQIPNKSGRTINFALMALFGLQTKESEDLVLAHSNKKNVNISEATSGCKTVVLLISGLDMSPNVILYLIDIYTESFTSLQQTGCEFIWLPIHSDAWSASLEEQYTKLSQMMPWYTVHHPKLITEKTKKFIADIWKFERKPIMVVVNEDGDVVCPNAIHMMNIWRGKAFPFTRIRERTLWKDETRVDSLVLGFDANISSMLEASKWVILYGGMDVEWIRKFITCIQGISADSGKFIEMIYAGKNAQSEKMRELISSSVSVNTLRSYSLDSKKKWYFWTRLESLLISRYQAVTTSDYAMDPIIGEVKKLLSYASAESWACLITPSSDLLIHDLGDTMLQGFMEYDSWKQHLSRKDFPKIFFDHMEQLRKSQMFVHPCNRIILNTDNKDVVQSLECPHCNYLMEKKIQYRCCHTDGDDNELE